VYRSLLSPQSAICRLRLRADVSPVDGFSRAHFSDKPWKTNNPIASRVIQSITHSNDNRKQKSRVRYTLSWNRRAAEKEPIGISLASKIELMPSKRTFAKRLVALATTGLAVDRPISALTSVPPDTGGSAQSAAVKLDTASDHPQRGDQQTSLEPQSAVAAGKYDPTVAATEAVDTVAIGRLSPQVLKTTGLPPELATRIHPLLDRYDAISLDAIQQVVESRSPHPVRRDVPSLLVASTQPRSRCC